MTEIVCFVISLAAFVGSVIWSVLLAGNKNKCRRVITPMNVLFAGVMVAAVVLFVPMYFRWHEGQAPQNDTLLQVFDSILLAVHSAIGFFIVDGDYGTFFEYAQGGIAPYYVTLALILMVIAPMLTFGFVISFFKNLSAYAAFLCCYFRDVYVFSELNEKSLALAWDLKKNHPNIAILFTDVFCTNDDEIYELQQGARSMGAICFKKDILAINFHLHSGKREIWFFAIAEEESTNLTQGLRLVELYGCKPGTHLYVFTTSAESEVLFASSMEPVEGNGSPSANERMKIRRVNPIRSLITRTLYDEGIELFWNARPAEDGKKQIGAVVVGLGEYGTNMVKSLAWCCQMDGYSVRIDAFDQDPLAEDKFRGQCPELMDEKHNGTSVPGEAEYTIRIHSDTHVNTKTFADKIACLTDTTYVLVALGSDGDNIKTALQLRMLFERMGIKPVIQAIVYDSEKKRALTGRRNYKDQPYQIEYIGDLHTSYTEKVIIDSEIEADALARHLRGGWYTQWQFWAYEYFYHSSVAAALHAKLRVLCQIPGAEKAEADLTEEERVVLERLEHRRWNAYMRAEGYVFSGSQDGKTRNDLAKMHHDLVPYETLSEKEKRKDSQIGSN